MSGLDEQNFKKGLLIDEQLMAGVTENAGEFVAFVLCHETGEYLSYQSYPQLNLALNAIGSIPRAWVFEATGGCSGGKCEEGKSCSDGSCKLSCSSESCSPQESLS